MKTPLRRTWSIQQYAVKMIRTVPPNGHPVAEERPHDSSTLQLQQIIQLVEPLADDLDGGHLSLVIHLTNYLQCLRSRRGGQEIGRASVGKERRTGGERDG